VAARDSNLSRRRALRALVAALVGAVVLLLLLLKVTPEPYRRAAALGANLDALAQFNRDVVNGVGNVLLDRSGGTRLDLEMTEAMVNARLTRFVADEARQGRAVAPALDALRIAFEPGRIVLATRLGEGLTAVVVSQECRPIAEEDGRLRVEAGALRAGLLPVPVSAVDRLRSHLAQARVAFQSAGEPQRPADLLADLLEALEGQPVALGKGRKRILLDRIEVERGVLRVRGHRQAAPRPQ